MLGSALVRPQNLYAYEQADIFVVAAAYGYGIAKNHAFIDGNKRTAFLVMFTFLKVNGWHLVVPEPDAVITIQQVAASIMTESLLANWLKGHSPYPIFIAIMLTLGNRRHSILNFSSDFARSIGDLVIFDLTHHRHLCCCATEKYLISNKQL
jgi:death on curing protein